MSRWFRVYDDLVDDPKVQRLPPELFKALINLWCLASKNGGELPAVEHISFTLRMRPEKTVRVLADLRDAGLIDCDDSGRRPHNWDRRQFKSDVTDPTNTERQKRFRNAKRNGDRNAKRNGDRNAKRNGDRNGESNTQSNDQNQSTESETEKPSVSVSRSRARSKAELPVGFALRPEDIAYAEARGWSPAKIAAELERFCDHAQATGRRQANWQAAWRSWVTSPYSNPPNGAKNGHIQAVSPLLAAADKLVADAHARLTKHSGEGGLFDGAGEVTPRPIPARESG